MSHASWLKALALAVALIGSGGVGSARAQDWTDYLHWPYVPPQVPGNGFEYRTLYDGFYLYPREQRIVPQIQGPYYRNFYGGKRHLGYRHPNRLARDGTRRNSTRATTSSSTSSEPDTAPRRVSRSSGRPPDPFLVQPAQVAGDLIIGLDGRADLVELDPLILRVCLGDVARPEDQAGQARRRRGARRRCRRARR